MALSTRPATPRLLFCSYHSYLEPSNGAALATRDLLELLAARGWECAVLCGPEEDSAQPTPLEGTLRSQNVPFQFRPGRVRDCSCTLYHCALNRVAVHAFVPVPAQPRQPPSREEGHAFLSLFDLACQRFRPDLLLTYGGQWCAYPLISRAKQMGVKVVFALHNCEYTGADLFREADAILVPSRAVEEHYRSTLGLASTPLPGPWDWGRVLCRELQGHYITFVNPQPAKGVFWFARIAYELNRRRPDIPLLVVEGRGNTDWLARCDLDLSGLTNLHRMPSTYDPRHFYRVSRAVLMPSLWQEALGRVAVESSINGIPVLASRRGGLPEALAGAGFLFDIPEQYTATSCRTPTAEEVAPWSKVIEQLWDDGAYHAAEGERSRRAAETWRPERLGPRFEEFFLQVMQKRGR